MSTFSYEHGVPSIRLTKDVLEALERYIPNRIAEACNIAPEDARKGFSIHIVDREGTEHFDSIEQFTPSRFSDSTEKITVDLDARKWSKEGPFVSISLRFSRTRLFSSILITATAPNAREISVGLKDGVLRMLDPHKTWHWWCHPTAEVWGTYIAASIGLAVAAWQLHSKQPVYPLLLVTIMAFCLYALQSLLNLRPYTIFDSRAAERGDKIWSWFAKGLMTFLVFGTLLTLIRKYMFDF